MKRAASVCLCWIMSLAAASAMAQGWLARTSANVHLRAGPGADYPVVAVLPTGVDISVEGCLSDYSWCDVVAPPYRGWMYAAYIHYPYQDRSVPLLEYGPQIGIAILSFMLLDYWHDHYRDRPFYRERERWARRPAPPQAPPPVRRAAPPRDREGGGRPPPAPRAQHPQPPRQAAPGVQRPEPPRPAPGAERREPPRQAAPPMKRPEPPREPAREGQRPQPPRETGPGKGHSK